MKKAIFLAFIFLMISSAHAQIIEQYLQGFQSFFSSYTNIAIAVALSIVTIAVAKKVNLFGSRYGGGDNKIPIALGIAVFIFSMVYVPQLQIPDYIGQTTGQNPYNPYGGGFSLPAILDPDVLPGAIAGIIFIALILWAIKEEKFKEHKSWLYFALMLVFFVAGFLLASVNMTMFSGLSTFVGIILLLLFLLQFFRKAGLGRVDLRGLRGGSGSDVADEAEDEAKDKKKQTKKLAKEAQGLAELKQERIYPVLDKIQKLLEDNVTVFQKQVEPSKDLNSLMDYILAFIDKSETFLKKLGKKVGKTKQKKRINDFKKKLREFVDLAKSHEYLIKMPRNYGRKYFKSKVFKYSPSKGGAWRGTGAIAETDLDYVMGSPNILEKIISIDPSFENIVESYISDLKNLFQNEKEWTTRFHYALQLKEKTRQKFINEYNNKKSIYFFLRNFISENEEILDYLQKYGKVGIGGIKLVAETETLSLRGKGTKKLERQVSTFEEFSSAIKEFKDFKKYKVKRISFENIHLNKDAFEQLNQILTFAQQLKDQDYNNKTNSKAVKILEELKEIHSSMAGLFKESGTISKGIPLKLVKKEYSHLLNLWKKIMKTPDEPREQFEKFISDFYEEKSKRITIHGSTKDYTTNNFVDIVNPESSLFIYNGLKEKKRILIDIDKPTIDFWLNFFKKKREDLKEKAEGIGFKIKGSHFTYAGHKLRGIKKPSLIKRIRKAARGYVSKHFTYQRILNHMEDKKNAYDDILKQIGKVFMRFHVNIKYLVDLQDHIGFVLKVARDSGESVDEKRVKKAMRQAILNEAQQIQRLLGFLGENLNVDELSKRAQKDFNNLRKLGEFGETLEKDKTLLDILEKMHILSKKEIKHIRNAFDRGLQNLTNDQLHWLDGAAMAVVNDNIGEAEKMINKFIGSIGREKNIWKELDMIIEEWTDVSRKEDYVLKKIVPYIDKVGEKIEEKEEESGEMRREIEEAEKEVIEEKKELKEIVKVLGGLSRKYIRKLTSFAKKARGGGEELAKFKEWVRNPKKKIEGNVTFERYWKQWVLGSGSYEGKTLMVSFLKSLEDLKKSSEKLKQEIESKKDQINERVKEKAHTVNDVQKFMNQINLGIASCKYILGKGDKKTKNLFYLNYKNSPFKGKDLREDLKKVDNVEDAKHMYGVLQNLDDMLGKIDDVITQLSDMSS